MNKRFKSSLFLLIVTFVCLSFFKSVIFAQEDKATIFSDANYEHPTNNFPAGQIIYVRVEADGVGDKQKILRILDQSKKEIQRFLLEQKQSNQIYLYTATFAAPQKQGLYYVDIKIEGNGFSYASQENINIDGQSNNVSISSKAKSSVTGVVMTPIPTSTTISNENKFVLDKIQPFFTKIEEFISHLFFRLRS